jgi:hypothetical protein
VSTDQRCNNRHAIQSTNVPSSSHLTHTRCSDRSEAESTEYHYNRRVRNTLLLSLPLLKLFNKRRSLLLRHNVNLNQIIRHLNLATAQQLQQNKLLASLDQPARNSLHVALRLRRRILALLIPRRRQDILQVIAQRLILGARFHEIALGFQRVKEDHREAENGLGIVDVRETDGRVLHVRRAGRRAREDPAGPQREFEVGLLAGGALFAFLAPLLEVCDGLDALGDPQLNCFERLAAGVELQAAFGGVEGFGQFVEGQAGGCGAVPGFDVTGVELEGGCAVSVARAVVLCGAGREC